jgi:hypothetical protein
MKTNTIYLELIRAFHLALITIGNFNKLSQNTVSVVEDPIGMLYLSFCPPKTRQGCWADINMMVGYVLLGRMLYSQDMASDLGLLCIQRTTYFFFLQSDSSNKTKGKQTYLLIPLFWCDDDF